MMMAQFIRMMLLHHILGESYSANGIATPGD